VYIELLYCVINFELVWTWNKVAVVENAKKCRLYPAILYSFYNDGILNHFEKYYTKIASVHRYQTRLGSLQKYHLPKVKTSLGQLCSKYTGPKIWSDIPENLKPSPSPYSSGKQYTNAPLSCQNFCWSSFYMLVTSAGLTIVANVAIATGPALFGAPRSSVINPIYYIIYKIGFSLRSQYFDKFAKSSKWRFSVD